MAKFPRMRKTEQGEIVGLLSDNIMTTGMTEVTVLGWGSMLLDLVEDHGLAAVRAALESIQPTSMNDDDPEETGGSEAQQGKGPGDVA